MTDIVNKATQKLFTDQEVRDYLAKHEVPQFIDQFILSAIAKPEDDWRKVMLQMVESVERSTAKGGRAKAAMLRSASSATEAGPQKFSWDDPFAGLTDPAPDYCKRDPLIRPSARSIMAKGVVTNGFTAGNLTPPQVMRDNCSTVAAKFNYAANQCVAQAKVIQQACMKADKPFFDEKFWYGHRHTMYPKGAPADCTVTEPRKAMRVSELYPNAPLFSNGTESNDIVQGAIGDCFFIGALSALACSKRASLKPIQRLFIFADTKYGIYAVMLYKNGGWTWVIIDEWIAVEQDAQGSTWPQYAQPGTEPELWPMLLEKAYAKVHFCWDSIDGGWARCALEDLTGGNAYTLDLAKKHRSTFGTTPERLQALFDNPLAILSCSVGWHIEDRGGAGRAGEQGTIGGLFKGHAYSIVNVKTCSDGQAFVQVRNPWGNGAEWTGAYSDKSREWDRHPLHQRELRPEQREDGVFWMKWEDFRAVFTDIDVVEFFPYDDVVFSFFGAAPARDFVERNVFIVKADRPCHGVFTVAQEDPLCSKDHARRKRGKFKGMMLSVFRLRRLPTAFRELEDCFGEKVQTEPCSGRTLFQRFDFEAGHYAVVPRMRHATGIGYYLRLVVPPTAEISMWQWDEANKVQDTRLAQQLAAQVPVVAPVGAGPARIGVEAPAAGGVSEAAIEGFGIPDRAKLQRMCQKVFLAVDGAREGSLDREQGLAALKLFMTRLPKIIRSFDVAYQRVGKGLLGPMEFRELVDRTLESLFTE